MIRCLTQLNLEFLLSAPEEFDSLDQEKLQYNYSWIYDKKPKDEKEEKEVSEDLMKEMGRLSL